MDYAEAVKISAAYRHGVETGDQVTWLDLWADEPQLVVAYGLGDPPPPLGAERHIGKAAIARLIFGASDRLENPRFTAERILLVADEPNVFFWQFHLEIKAKDGPTFDNDLMIKITTENGKIKEFLEFGDPRKRGALFSYLEQRSDIDIDTPSATLLLELTEDISAYSLQCLIALLNNSYFDWLFLHLAEQSASSSPFPEDWLPDANQELWIRRVEIGTPNFMELLGDPAALQYVHDYLSMIVASGMVIGVLRGGSKAILEASQAYLNFEKAREIRSKANLVPKAADLEKKGRITSQTLETKQSVQSPIEHLVAAAALVKDQKLIKSQRRKKTE